MEKYTEPAVTDSSGSELIEEANPLPEPHTRYDQEVITEPDDSEEEFAIDIDSIKLLHQQWLGNGELKSRSKRARLRTSEQM